MEEMKKIFEMILKVLSYFSMQKLLRTIAAVGRQHIRYVFVANHKTNVTNDFTENVIDGTELRQRLTSQISSLTSFSIASIRLQAMLALLWLTLAPSEYHNSQSNEEGASYINDLKHFRTILYSIEEFPREMGREFFHSFKERICLSPSLTPLLLRWYYYPFARNACDIKYIVDLWNTCSDLGPEPRQWTLRQIFSLLDGDHGYYNNFVNRNDKNRNFYELHEVHVQQFNLFDNFGYELFILLHLGGNGDPIVLLKVYFQLINLQELNLLIAQDDQKCKNKFLQAV